jgi:hypothetical protein
MIAVVLWVMSAVLLVGAIAFATRLTRSHKPVITISLQIGTTIAAARVAVVFLALAFLRRPVDRKTVWGVLLLAVDAPLESIAAFPWNRADGFVWPLLLTMMIVATSFAGAFAWVEVLTRVRARRWSVSMTVGVAVIASAVLNALAVFVGRGSFVHMLAVAVVTLYIAGPALVVAACAFLLRKRVAAARGLAYGAAIAACALASTLVSLWPGREIAKHDIEVAETRCESLIPPIEDFQRVRGVYPSAIATMTERPDMRRIGQDCQYWSDGSSFHFNLGDPRGIMNFIGFDSRTRRWSEWH